MDLRSVRLLGRASFVIGLSALAALAVAVVPHSWSDDWFAAAQEPAPDLAITKTDEPDPVLSNATLTYTVVVSNIGDAPAGTQDVPIKVIDIPPDGFVFESFAATPVGSCIVTLADLRCEITTLDPGESVTITISGTIARLADDVVQNTALVDLPISDIPELIEVTNNIALTETTILGTPVGGLAVELDGGLGDLPLETPQSSGHNAGVLAGAIAGIAALAVTLGGVAWYARRRWAR